MKILSVDFGDARTGLAACDPQEMLASPVGVIHSYHMEQTATEVVKAAQDCNAELVIVGYPRNMNGTVGERAEKCAAFAEMLKAQLPIPVELWDERVTTVQAHKIMNATNTRGKKRKDTVDAVAAVLILENYLTYRKNRKEK